MRQGEHVARLRELGEEELQQPEVAVLRRAAHGVAQPLGKPLAARCRDGVVAPPPAGLLARLFEQAGLGEASGLGVELGVGKGPEVPDAQLDEALEVVGRGRPAQGGDPEHEVGGRAEPRFG